MNRRGILQAAFAGAAMAVIPLALADPILYGDGLHDDTRALQRLMDGEAVMRSDGSYVLRGSDCITVPSGIYRLSDTLWLTRPTDIKGAIFRASHEGPLLGLKDSAYRCYIEASFVRVK